MDAWTDLNQAVIRDRLRERTDAATAERFAADVRAATNANRIVEPTIHWFELVSRRDQAQENPDAVRRNFEAVLSL